MKYYIHRSTEMSLMKQKEILMRTVEQKFAVLGVLIDFAKHLITLIIVYQLINASVRLSAAAVFVSYLEHRQQYVSQ